MDLKCQAQLPFQRLITHSMLSAPYMLLLSILPFSPCGWFQALETLLSDVCWIQDMLKTQTWRQSSIFGGRLASAAKTAPIFRLRAAPSPTEEAAPPPARLRFCCFASSRGLSNGGSPPCLCQPVCSLHYLHIHKGCDFYLESRLTLWYIGKNRLWTVKNRICGFWITGRNTTLSAGG